jgi:hypothetical protein
MTSTKDQATNLLKKAQELLENVSKLKIESDGFAKYKTAIKSEVKFLQRILLSKELKDAHVKCSNYTHLNAIYDIIKNEEACQVNQIIPSGFRVDVVVDNGLTWVKLKCGSDASIKGELFGYEEEEDESDEEDGGEERGQLAVPDPSIIKQAKRWIEASKTDLIHFQRPQVIFQFVGCNELPQFMYEQLIALGIDVKIGQYKQKNK